MQWLWCMPTLPFSELMTCLTAWQCSKMSRVSFSCWQMHTLWTLRLTARICMRTLTACQKAAFLIMCHFQEGQAQALVVLPHLMASCWLLAVTADLVPGHMVTRERKGLACGYCDAGKVLELPTCTICTRLIVWHPALFHNVLVFVGTAVDNCTLRLMPMFANCTHSALPL